MENERKVCCFFGPRKIEETEQLRSKIYSILEILITEDNVNTFIFGSRSEFDSLCREIVGHIKEKYPYIHRIYIRAEYRFISEEYERYLLSSCDETYYSSRAVNGGRAVYVQRNYEMIDKSDICVVYYNEEYKPPRGKTSSKDIMEHQPASGTQRAYDYAIKKGKTIINLYE